MKHLPLIALLVLISCGEHSKRHRKIKSSSGIPFVLVTGDVLPDPVNNVVDNNTSSNNTNNNTDSNTDNNDDDTVVDNTNDNTVPDQNNDQVTDTDTDIDSDNNVVDDVISPDAKVLVCDFTKDSEKETFTLNLNGNGSEKYAVLSDTNGKSKAVFGGFILSPSGNEHAAVQHVDKDFSIEEGKVIKITARIVLDSVTGEGELQLSYKVKAGKNKTVDTEFEKLAEIDNCSEQD